jgi:O-antigen/teichoic acid export membrane protein
MAEVVVLISAAGLLANLILLKWRKQLARPSDHPESPWTPEFISFVFISLACVGGGYCFMQGDQLVAKRYLGKEDLDAYTAAGLLARALPMTVGPLLTVLFTYRSGQHQADNLREQLKLLALYGSGLLCGAAGLIALGGFCLKILNRYSPEVHAMLMPLAITMVFVGLLQSLALWSLASRWSRLAIFYGVLGLGYWLVLLAFGRSLDVLLRLMPIAAGLAFVALLATWILALRSKRAVN